MGRSGIHSAVGAIDGLCSWWEAGNLLQRAGGAMGLRYCKVGKLGYYTDPASLATLFDFLTGNLANWCHPNSNILIYQQVRLIVPWFPSASKLQIYWPLRGGNMIALPVITHRSEGIGIDG